MDRLNKSIKIKFFLALICSICLPAGILLIIFSGGKVGILATGIVLAVLGFYGTPMLWISYANTKSLKTTLRLITNEHIYTVQDLASQLSVDKKQVELSINTLITKGFLTGFLFHDGILELNTNKKQTGTAKTTKCPNCGGIMTFDGIHYICDYCGFVLEENKK